MKLGTDELRRHRGEIPRLPLGTIHLFLQAGAVSPGELRAVLEGNVGLRIALWPLAVALVREVGESPRVPLEVSEVADDIAAQFRRMRKSGDFQWKGC